MPVDTVKVLIAERNGVDLSQVEEFNLEADVVPFSPLTSGLASDAVGPALRELAVDAATSASPGFSWARQGNTPVNTWLQNDGVPSNITGRFVFLYSATISKLFVSNQNVASYTVGIYAHDGDGINMALLGSVSVSSARGGEFTVNLAVAKNKQLATRITAGAVANVVVGAIVSGSLTP